MYMYVHAYAYMYTHIYMITYIFLRVLDVTDLHCVYRAGSS